MSVGELPLFPVSARDELQAHYNDLLALQDQADQVPLAKALDAVGLALSVLGHAQNPLVPAGKQARFKREGEKGKWFGVFDWHNDPGFEYRTVYAHSDTSTVGNSK